MRTIPEKFTHHYANKSYPTKHRYKGRRVHMCCCLYCGEPLAKSTNPETVCILHGLTKFDPDSTGAHFVWT